MKRLLIAVAALMLAGCASPAMAQSLPTPTFAVRVAQAPTSTPTPLPTPGMDPTLSARATLAAVELAEQMAMQARLQVTVMAAEATNTAWPAAATQTQAAAFYQQATAQAVSLTQQAPVTATAQYVATATAYAPTAVAIQQAQDVAPVMNTARVMLLFVLALVVGYVGYLVAQKIRLDVVQAQNEVEIQRIEIEQARQKMQPRQPAPRLTPRVEFTPAPSSGGSRLVRKPPFVTTAIETRIAQWVNDNGGWRDAMRNGEGVGISHEQLVEYRDYLLEIGILVESGNGYAVRDMEYFRLRALGGRPPHPTA